MAHSHLSRKDLLDRVRAAFTARDAGYPDKRKGLQGRCNDIGDVIREHQSEGLSMTCSEQMLEEAVWLVHYTDDWARAERQIAAAKASLDSPDQQRALTQDSDGSWGACMLEWYRKLEPSVDALQMPGLDPKLIRPLAFLSRFASTPRVLGYLWRLQISNIRATGINQRDELGAVQTALAQLLFKDALHDLLHDNDLGFRFDADMERAFVEYLSQTQHPRNGYWGPWYNFDGELVMAQDLSFTFHIVNYRRGNIGNWPRVVDTTLEIKGLIYPAGWKPDADTNYNLHNAYDVATIFSYGWPHMDWKQKGLVRTELAAMLDWCLTEAIDGGAFKIGDDTALEIYYFGVRLLDTLGFWNPDRCFWHAGAPPRPDGTPEPDALARSLLAAFARYDDKSEEADEVLRILTWAARRGRTGAALRGESCSGA